MNRGRRRAVLLWSDYQRRRMSKYVLDEKAYKKKVVNYLVSDGIELLHLSNNGVEVKVCHQKFDTIITTLQAIPHPSIPSGLGPRAHLINIARILSQIKQSVV